MKNTTKAFSGPLMKQTCRANMTLAVVVLLIMCLITSVINYAMSIMGTDKKDGIDEDLQEDLFTYMFVIAAFNEASGSELSYDDFLDNDDHGMYETAFDIYNATQDDEEELTVDEFEKIVSEVEAADVDSEIYVQEFEYAYQLSGSEGVFTGSELAMDDFLNVVLEASGINEDDMEKMQALDFTTYFNKMYFTVLGLLPLFVLVMIAANSLIAAQVDKGSMAYILSTPTKRLAVAVTQALYMLLVPLVILAVTCCVKIATGIAILGDIDIPRTITLYIGMYLVVEAAAGICYLCSCIFNQSSKALSIGGGITLWFFLAALLGMFGSEDMVNMGVGSETLDIFNKLTIISLFDADAVQTIGTNSVDTGFVPGMIILAVIAVICYAAGCVKFCKKDLPL